MDTAQVLKIQEELARQTLAQPTQRHKRLYRLVRDPGWLRAGLDAVLSNPGSHTPGVDGITKRHIDSHTEGRDRLVQQLHEELWNETYRPQPVKRVYIPKANGKRRPLGIACLRDRAVQATVKMVLEPIYDSVFHPFSWGFRPSDLLTTPSALSAGGQPTPSWGSSGSSRGTLLHVSMKLTTDCSDAPSKSGYKTALCWT